MNQERNLPERNNDKGRSIAEWTTLGISVAIVVAVVGLVTYLFVQGTEEEPRIVAEAKLEELRNEESGYYLPVEVTNEGDKTIEDVTVEGELDTGSGQLQTAEFTLTFLAGGERVQGTLVFEDDPTQGQLTVHATSFREP